MTPSRKAFEEFCKDKDIPLEDEQMIHNTWQAGAEWQRERDAKICEEVEKTFKMTDDVKAHGASACAHFIRKRGAE